MGDSAVDAASSAVVAGASDDNALTSPEDDAVVRDAVPTLLKLDDLGSGIQALGRGLHDVGAALASVSSMSSLPESSSTPSAFDAARCARFLEGEASSIVASSEAPLDHFRL